MRWPALLAVGLIVLGHTACAASQAASPRRYRLAESGSLWAVSGSDRVLDDLRPRYAEFFDVILDPTKARVPNLRILRDDLEHVPVDRRNFDALNAIAIAYFETNHRAESGRGDGLVYLALSQRSAKLLAVPWRAYGETFEPELRAAIIDFFEDAGSGRKLDSAATAPRLVRIVSSLEKKEQDPHRIERIRSLTRSLEASSAAMLPEVD